MDEFNEPENAFLEGSNFFSQIYLCIPYDFMLVFFMVSILFHYFYFQALFFDSVLIVLIGSQSTVLVLVLLLLSYAGILFNVIATIFVFVVIRDAIRTLPNI